MLAYRQRSKKEINDRLRQKGYQQEVIDSVLEFLKEYQLIDDYQFACSWVEHRMAIRPMGVKGIKYELKKHGIDNEITESVLSKIDSEDELALAKQLIQKKINNHSGFNKRKAAALLQRRGFSYDIISRILFQLDMS